MVARQTATMCSKRAASGKIHAALCRVTPRYAALRRATQRYIAPRCTTPCYAALRRATPRYAVLRRATLHYAAQLLPSNTHDRCIFRCQVLRRSATMHMCGWTLMHHIPCFRDNVYLLGGFILCTVYCLAQTACIACPLLHTLPIPHIFPDIAHHSMLYWACLWYAVIGRSMISVNRIVSHSRWSIVYNVVQ